MNQWIGKAGFVFVVSMLAATSQAADPVALTPQELAATMAKMPSSDVKRGEAVHTQKFCAGCHGKEGLSQNPAWPNVAGQPKNVTIKSLLDYRGGRRAKGAAVLMAGIAKTLTDQQIADVAAYYESMAGGPAAKEAPKIDPVVLRMVTRGDAKRAISPCATCHGTTARGNATGEVPVLHGQHAAYLAATLKDYRSGTRSADMLKEMRFFAAKLTDSEIDQLAAYYASQQGRESQVAP